MAPSVHHEDRPPAWRRPTALEAECACTIWTAPPCVPSAAGCYSAAAALVGRLSAHCLLVESPAGLILVDTAFGTEDVADPGRLGRQFLTVVRPRLHLARTALHQIRALGYDPQDVRHIVLTHLDLDHAGGISDFPHARIHVLAEELRAARARSTRAERDRYRPGQWAHGPHWVEHPRDSATENWYGLQGIPILPRDIPDLLLVPLPGHSRGHCGLAVRDADRWLLHCGDAYFSHTDVDPAPRAGRSA
ncbi:MBL fold metallo-hydrolase [Kitasatospora aburaviensis]